MNIDYVKPGAESVKYHSHSKQEEFYFIMSGKGILRIDGKEILIKTDDVISAPAGKDNGHQFINNGSECLILTIVLKVGLLNQMNNILILQRKCKFMNNC